LFSFLDDLLEVILSFFALLKTVYFFF